MRALTALLTGATLLGVVLFALAFRAVPEPETTGGDLCRAYRSWSALAEQTVAGMESLCGPRPGR